MRRLTSVALGALVAWGAAAHGDEPGARSAAPYVASLPPVCGCTTRREHVPAEKVGRFEVRHFTRINPTYVTRRRPQLRTESVPVWGTKDVPVFEVRRTPRYEDVEITVYGWREVPNVIERKREVWETVERPRLVTREVPAERLVIDPVYANGEEPIERTVRTPRVECQTDPTTGRTCRVVTGHDEKVVNEGTRRFTTLTGYRSEVRPHGIRLEWAEEGVRTEQVFKGVEVERIVQGTRRERVAIGSRTERRHVGFDEVRIPCGTRRERVKVGTRDVTRCVGWLEDRERVGFEEEEVPYTWECVEESCGPSGTRPVREPIALPGVSVTVVPDGSIGHVLLPGTTTMMGEREFAAERARRAALTAPR